MKAALDDSDMRNARFIKAKLSLSNMQGARMDGADLRGIRGRYAIWRRLIGGMRLWMIRSKRLFQKMAQTVILLMVRSLQNFAKSFFHPIGNGFLLSDCIHAGADCCLNRVPAQDTVLVFNLIMPCN